MRNEIVVGNIYELLADALEMSAKKLRTPSKTKLDENGLAPCGCGGSAQYENTGDSEFKVAVKCTKCYTRTDAFRNKRFAQEAWNEAMGWPE